MGIKFDFSDIDMFFEEAIAEMEAEMASVGQDAVGYAVKNGTYRDRTGTLRSSNKFDVDKTGLTLVNDAESPEGYNYASNVESKGYDVLSGAALFAYKRLREGIG